MLTRAALLLRTGVATLSVLVLAVGSNVLLLADERILRLISIIVIIPAPAALWWSYRRSDRILPLHPSEAESKAAIRHLLDFVDSRLGAIPSNGRIDVPVVLYDQQQYRQSGDMERVPQEEVLQSWDALVAHFSEDPQCSLIVGPSGAGKTTVLLTLARRLLGEAATAGKPYVPIPLSLRSWGREGESLQTWILRRSGRDLGLPNFVTASWLRRGSAVLFLDDLDELEPKNVLACLSEIKDWTGSARGSRVVLACYPTTARSVASRLGVDSVAALQPVSAITLQSFVGRFGIKGSYTPPSTEIAVKLLELARPYEQLYEDLRRPFFAKVLAWSLSSNDSDETSGRAGDRDPGMLGFLLGNDLAAQGDLPGAAAAYSKAMEARGSAWRAPAAVRLSLLLSARGESDEARAVLNKAVAYSLEASFRPIPIEADIETLSADERQVLSSMSSGRTYDEAQISSGSFVPPSATASVVRSLRLRGLLETADDGLGNSRFAKR